MVNSRRYSADNTKKPTLIVTMSFPNIYKLPSPKVETRLVQTARAQERNCDAKNSLQRLPFECSYSGGDANSLQRLGIYRQ